MGLALWQARLIKNDCEANTDLVTVYFFGGFQDQAKH